MTEAKCFPSCIWFTASKAGTRENIWHKRADFYSLDSKNRAQFKSGFFLYYVTMEYIKLKADVAVKALEQTFVALFKPWL
jgi:hypothetical protein